MKIVKLILLLTILFNTGHHCYAQPGEESDKKYNIHEIKLYDGEDGSKAGAIAWTTAAPDSVQKFVIRNLSIMEPVQVLLQALSSNDEVKLQFVKEKWSEPESSISAKGKDIGKKIFRTYKTAAMKISAQKAGIPYLIIVQVGKKLPVSNSNFIKITDDKDKYEDYMKNKGKTTSRKTEAEAAVIPVANNVSGGGNTPNNSSLLYIIIALLALMVALLGYFIFVRKGGKKMLLLLLLFGFGFNSSWGQSPTDPGPVDIGALVVSREEFNALVNELRATNNLQYGNIDDNYRLIDQNRDNIESIEQWVNELIEDVDDVNQRTVDHFNDLQAQFNQFKIDFEDNMPGEDTEGGNRYIDPELLEGELNEIKSKLRSLEAQVEFLSARDRESAPPEDFEDDEEGSWDWYCPQSNMENCLQCGREFNSQIADLQENFLSLNRILKHKDWVMEVAISTGNNTANMAPGFALGWQRQLIRIQMSRRSLWSKYHDKHAELYGRYQGMLTTAKECLNRNDGDLNFRAWMDDTDQWIDNNAPVLATPIF